MHHIRALHMVAILFSLLYGETREAETIHRILTTPVASHKAAEFEAAREKGKPCGDGRCMCFGTVASCSGIVGIKLTYIPALPDSIQTLYFSFNNLTTIDNDDFFQNATNITYLTLTENRLVNVSIAALKVLRMLQHLELKYNRLTPSAVIAILSVSTLRSLDISGNRFAFLPESLFFTHPMLKLTDLSLDGNMFSKLNMTEFLPLVQLHELYVGNNPISDNIFPACLPSLLKLDLRGNAIFTFPETCTKNGSSFYPNLMILFIGKNRLQTLPERICLPSLTHIDLDGNDLSVLKSGMFGQRHFPKLQAVSVMSTQDPYCRIEKGAFSNPSLQEIYMSHYSDGEGRTMTGAFTGCPNLRELHLSYVDFSLLDDHELQMMFQELENLLILNLFRAGISRLTTSTFESLKSLEQLVLDGNFITILPDGVFDALKNLKILTLSGNQISTVRETTFSAATRRRLLKLKLNGNPFKCDCDLRWFQEWLSSDPGLFVLYYYHYECGGSQKDEITDKITINKNRIILDTGRAGMGVDEIRIEEDGRRIYEDRTKKKDGILDSGRLQTGKGIVKIDTIRIREEKNGAGMQEYGMRGGYLYKPALPSAQLREVRLGTKRVNAEGVTVSTESDLVPIVSFYVPDQACLLSPETSRLIIISVSFPMVMLTSFLLLYSYRWHIRLLLYDAFRGKGDRQRRLQEQNFDYDVFVSYDSDDFDWVYHTLTPYLENDLELSVCLHNRDFIPGKDIFSNIVDCVESSKKIMAVFSTNFAKSPWCQFELTLCLSHVMTHDDALLIVMLHDIPARDLTSAMMAVMKTTTYIQWADEPEARASFWGRVRIALNEILPGV